MVDTLVDSQQTLLTYADVKEAHPEWSDIEVQDYLAIKQDISDVSGAADDVAVSEAGSDPRTTAMLSTLQDQLGSGDMLTSDETGFTVDSDKLYADMDEA
jgi:hypothetical protein